MASPYLEESHETNQTGQETDSRLSLGSSTSESRSFGRNTAGLARLTGGNGSGARGLRLLAGRLLGLTGVAGGDGSGARGLGLGLSGLVGDDGGGA